MQIKSRDLSKQKKSILSNGNTILIILDFGLSFHDLSASTYIVSALGKGLKK